jgi:hypothetical protein
LFILSKSDRIVLEFLCSKLIHTENFIGSAETWLVFFQSS